MALPELSGSDLRREVYSLITRELGAAVLVRFIQENYPGQGDYTKERQAKGQPKMDDILNDLSTTQDKFP